jgi:hypothetical protein
MIEASPKLQPMSSQAQNHTGNAHWQLVRLLAAVKPSPSQLPLTIVQVLLSSQRATQALPVALAEQGAAQVAPINAPAQLALKPMLLGAR